MNKYNKQYNLNEGRVIGNNIINYGGFPKNLNEVAEPTPLTNLPQVASAPPLPPGNQPKGVDFPTMTPTYPEQVEWWEAWQRANPSPTRDPNETWEAFRIRWQAYLDLWEAYQQWRIRLAQWYRDQMYPPG